MARTAVLTGCERSALLALCGFVLSAAVAQGQGDQNREDRMAWRAVSREIRMEDPLGLSADAFVTLAAIDFVPTGNHSLTLNFGRTCLSGGCSFTAGVPVPHGAQIVGIEMDACDFDAGAGVMELFLYRIPGVEGGLPVPLKSRVATGGAGCGYYAAGLTTPHTVDQYLDSYVAVVSVSSNGDTDERLSAVRVYYRSGPGEVVPVGTEGSLFQPE